MNDQCSAKNFYSLLRKNQNFLYNCVSVSSALNKNRSIIYILKHMTLSLFIAFHIHLDQPLIGSARVQTRFCFYFQFHFLLPFSCSFSMHHFGTAFNLFVSNILLLFCFPSNQLNEKYFVEIFAFAVCCSVIVVLEEKLGVIFGWFVLSLHHCIDRRYIYVNFE